MLPSKSCCSQFIRHFVGLYLTMFILSLCGVYGNYLIQNGSVDNQIFDLVSSSASPPPPPSSLSLLAEVSSNETCQSKGSTCSSCVKSKSCFYCYPTSSCLPFNLGFKGCPSIKETAYGTCLVNFKVLAISLGSMAGVILVAILITCCCCCKCQRKRSDWEVENQKENLTMRGSVIRDNAFARREERQKRVDEIKQKYGITENKYNRF